MAMAAISLSLFATACAAGDRTGPGRRAQVQETLPPTSTTVLPPSSAPTTAGASGPVGTTTTTAAGRAAGGAAKPSPRDWKLSVDGLGPVRVGMTLDQASAAAGVPLKPFRNAFCRTLVSGPGEPEMTFGADGSDRINFITVGKGITTVSGIGYASTEADVRRAYPGQIEASGSPNPYRLVYRPRSPSLSAFSLVFVLAGTGRVASMTAGLRNTAEAEEQCA